MAEAAIWALAGVVFVGTLGLWVCLAASVRLFRAPPPPPAPLLPMTLIKPIKGLDDDLAENLESIALCDSAGALQVIVALGSEEDPAYPVACAFADKHPDRDIMVLTTGPSGARMGKAHNMIEALPRAKHPLIVFSDSDVRTTPRLLAETSRAFSDGCDAVFALPRHQRGGGVGGVLLEAAMNHSFGLGAALAWRLVGFTHCAGAWMGYTREILRRSGGLEPIAHLIADDLALSQRVAKTGARGRLVSAPALLRETGEGLGATLRHLVKWAVIIRWSLPRLYLLLPLFNLGLLAAALVGVCAVAGRHLGLAVSLAVAAFGSRALVALLQDLLAGEGALPLPWYAALAFMDLGAVGFWMAGFKSEILWRGVRYRLSWGGHAEVVQKC